MSVATCIICLNAFSEELEIVSLKCRHCFHRNCIQEWIKVRKNCPQCRSNVMNRKQLNRVILSFETHEMPERSELDQALIESQNARIDELEAEISGKDAVLEAKEGMLNKYRRKIEQLSEKVLKNRRQVNPKPYSQTISHDRGTSTSYYTSHYENNQHQTQQGLQINQNERQDYQQGLQQGQLGHQQVNQQGIQSYQQMSIPPTPAPPPIYYIPHYYWAPWGASPQM